MTRLEIANAALRLLGSTPLTAWGENSTNGNLVSFHLAYALKQVLRETAWPNLLHIVELTDSDKTDPIYPDLGMIYAYMIPGDVFHLVEVNGKKTGWKLLKNVLHTNEPNPDILYLTEPSDDGIPEDIGHPLAFLLAFYLAPSITQDKDKANMMLQQYSLIITNDKNNIEQQLGNVETYTGWMTD